MISIASNVSIDLRKAVRGKRLVFAAVLCIMALVLPACGTSTSDQPHLRAGLVTNVGKVDDKSFNQSAWEGLLRARQELGASVQYVETVTSGDVEKSISAFAEAGNNVIVTVGFPLAEATRSAAVKYPNTRFIGVDQSQADGVIGNLAGLVFPEDQAGFLVGALAAMMTRTGTIGGVLGTDLVPAVWRFGEGYRAGARYIDPSINIQLVYHNDVGFDRTFVDPQWGAATAGSIIGSGADVIFGAGGETGNGAIIAAAAAGVYCIGVDTDQYYTLPEVRGKILSSAMKLITPGVFELVRRVQEGTFTGGEFIGQVGYAPYHETAAEVPAAVKERMENIKAALLDGSLLTGVPPARN